MIQDWRTAWSSQSGYLPPAIAKAVSTASRFFIITALVLTGCGNRETVLKASRKAILVQVPELVMIVDALAERHGLSQMIRNDNYECT